jgi:single-strand DNA-binding protein
MAFNKVILVGNVTADPELKQTQSGTSVCSFTIAVNRRFNKDGNNECDFINIVAWRQQAEFVSRYFKKGKPILVCGQLQTRSWTDKDGSKRYVTEVIADEVSFVGSNDTQAESKESAQGGFLPGTTAYMPTAYTDNAQGFEEIPNGDSLPF